MQNISEIIRPSQELLLISAQDSEKLTLIDPKTLAPLENFLDDSSPSKFTIQISNKFGHILAFQASKQILNIWNFNNKRLFLRIHVPERLVSTGLSNSELFFIGGGIQGNVYVWHTLTGIMVKKFKASQKKINAITFSKDDGFVIVAGDDGIINVFKSCEIFSQNNNNLFKDQNKGNDIRPFQQLLGHTDKISDIQLGCCHNRLYSVSRDKTMIVWDFAKGAKIFVQSAESEIKALAVHHSEQWVFLGCANGKIYQYRIENQQQQADTYENNNNNNSEHSSLQLKKWKNRVLEGHRSDIECLTFYTESNLLISGSKDGQLLFWNQEGQMVKKFSQYSNAITNLVIFSRPREFDAQNSKATQTTYKRPISFKPFAKFEKAQIILQQQQQQSGQIQNQSSKYDLDRFMKADGVTKKIRKNSFEKITQIKSFFKAHYRMVNRSRAECQGMQNTLNSNLSNNYNKNTDNNNNEEFQQITEEQQQSLNPENMTNQNVQDLILQNRTLKTKNHSLFVTQFKKSKKVQKVY